MKGRWGTVGPLIGLLGGVLGGVTTGCGPDGPRVIQGTGPVVREHREFLPLNSIEVKGCAELVIEVLPVEPDRLIESSGPGTFVYLEGAEDLLEWVETDLSGGTLTISFREGVRLDPLPSIEVQVGYLLEVASYGSGDIQLRGLTPRSTRGEALELTFAGSANLQAEGHVDELQIEQMGSGDLELRGLKSREASYSGLGSGEVWLYVTESLDATLAGSGDLFIHGPIPDGRIDTSVLGSAEVIRVRD